MSESLTMNHQYSETPVRDVNAIVTAGLKRRYAAEKRFRAYGITAIALALAALVILFVTIFGTGYSGFWQTTVSLPINLSGKAIDPAGTRDYYTLSKANYQGLVKESLRGLFPDVKSRSDRKALYDLVSDGAGHKLRGMVLDNPDLIGQTVTIEAALGSDLDQFAKGMISADVPEADRRVKDNQITFLKHLDDQGLIGTRLNWTFLSSADSREPEQAGIWGAIVGSFWTMLVTLLLSFPVAVAAAVYLEEFAPKNRWTDLIEVNINNLAAVPSIVFGLLGLAVFLNFFGLPRSAPLVGGLILMLMTLPTIIIAARASLMAVPPWIREAALGLGASPLQTVTHHVLPLAMPGILTGTIIGMARALGESAPLLMIGMVAFIADVPGGPLDPSTALPVQVYLWADAPERGFVEKTSAAIMVLLVFLILMNGAAVVLRKKFERKW